jgi:periplasmic protein TonB
MGRIISAMVPAALVTGGLLVLMHVLILFNEKAPEDGEEFVVPDIVMPDRKIDTRYDTALPDKPDEPEEPPPELPEPEFENLEFDNQLAVSPNLDLKANISGIGGFSSDGEFLPIVKVAAKYPSRALSRNLEGYCTVEYTVTKTGETQDIKVVDCPDSVFAGPSVKAAEKFKYKPRVVDGEPIEVPRVQNRFVFEMAKEEKG